MAWQKYFVKFGTKFNRLVYLSGESDEVNAINQRLANFVNAMGMTQAEAVRFCFLAGLDALEEKIDLDELEGDERVIAAVVVALRDKAKKAGLQEALSYYRTTTTDDDFAAFCEQHKVDPDGVPFRARMPAAPSWSERAGHWLAFYLADGQPHDPGEVRGAAEAAGLVRDQQDWANLQVVASRRKYTSQARDGWRKG